MNHLLVDHLIAAASGLILWDQPAPFSTIPPEVYQGLNHAHAGLPPPFPNSPLLQHLTNRGKEHWILGWGLYHLTRSTLMLESIRLSDRQVSMLVGEVYGLVTRLASCEKHEEDQG